MSEPTMRTKKDGRWATHTMKLAPLLVLAALVVSPAVFGSEPNCLTYEPALVSVTGLLVTRTFAGPPNYESLRAGDLAERAFLLLLDKPVCVEGDPGSEVNDETEVGVALIQVAPSEVIRKLIDHRITITGTLMHAQTAHHHTAVLLDAKEARPVSVGGHK